jgi:hypothetical protein
MSNQPLETSLRNPNDPLLKTGPERQRYLFETWSKVADGFSAQDVIGAAVNVLANAIRQSCVSYHGTYGAQALGERIKADISRLITEHYDVITGKRRNTFAHTQHVIMDHFKDPDGF